MALVELGRIVRQLITGEKQISASSPDIEYIAGIPRQVTTSSLRDKNFPSTPISKVTIEQIGKRQFANFRGGVEVQTSLNGETIAVQGYLINEQGNSEDSGIHIWWGGKHQTISNYVNVSVELENVGIEGECVRFRRREMFMRGTFVDPGLFVPPKIKLIELDKKGEEKVLKSNEKEVEEKWDDEHKGLIRRQRERERDVVIASRYKRYGFWHPR